MTRVADARRRLHRGPPPRHRRRAPAGAPAGRGGRPPSASAADTARGLLRRAGSRSADRTGAEPSDGAGSRPARRLRRRPPAAYAELAAHPARRSCPAAGTRGGRLRTGAPTRCGRAASSAPPSTSRRRTPGGSRSWPGSRPRWPRSATRSCPAAAIEDAVAHLDGRPRPHDRGHGAFRDWMQERSDAAVADLADVHFDIPEQIRTLECRIAPTQTGGIYYTGPSEDFTRPGRMWWSVPDGRHHVQHLARDDDRLPRGRPGPPPAGRSDGGARRSC